MHSTGSMSAIATLFEMAPSRFPFSSKLLATVALAASATAIDFGGQNDITQTAATVAPRGEMSTKVGANGFGNFDSPAQWTTSSSSSAPVTTPSVGSDGSGGWSQPTTTSFPSQSNAQAGGSGQDWGQPTPMTGGSQGWSQPTTTNTPSVWIPTSEEVSGAGDQGWPQQTPSSSESSGYADGTLGASGSSDESGVPQTGGLGLECSGSDESGIADTGGLSLECSGSDGSGIADTGGLSLECSGSDEGVHLGDGFSLECSGSDEEEQPSTPTSSAGSSNTTPTATTVHRYPVE
ncbi:unnamed protein product [Phytophthora fragariaefolia]|uniref:Unnamed protein product n=1 Tax=Phytophthora fragariaefolia TaxID=1490495 RepID=A0A9W7CPU4_9STRA|nr:unnamed protein product [Phytophthora fragariaefolia]